MRRLRYADLDTNDLAESVFSVVSQLNAIPLLGGQLIEGVRLSVVSPGTNTVTHGLGARPRGAIVVLQSGDADVKVLPAQGAEGLVLTTTAVVTVSLWVF